MLYRLLTRLRLRSGGRLHVARAYLLALLYEWHRICAWRQRHEPDTGKRRSWFDAWRATVENPPSLDRAWDELFEAEEE